VNEPLRLGIVGCGAISERHGPAADATPAVSIVACCDVRRDVAEEWRDRFGCERAYDDYRAMVSEHELDGVILATWPTLHRDQLLGCLDAGVRNILCEKSLALTGAEALEIWQAAEERGALVVEGYMYRHHPAFVTLLELVESGRTGPLDNVWAAFSLFDPADAAPDDPGLDWRRRSDRAGGVPWDLAGYCLDAANLVAPSPPRRAFAAMGTSAVYGTIDRLYALVEYEDGFVAMIESSLRSHFNHELRIGGSYGHAVLPTAWRIDHATDVIFERSVGWGVFETERIPIPETNPYVLQFEAFAAAARGDAPPARRLSESVVTACTLDALLESASAHAAVDISIPAPVAA
jgi:D-xylose 1-dehydrogenase (NADP+, D-xylono-1,5-lactone-forming)